MGFIDWLFKRKKKSTTANTTTSIGGLNIIVSTDPDSFGQDITKSLTVAMCLHAIAEEASKMILKSVKEVYSSNIVTANEDDKNVLFNSRPNRYMTMKDMLYSIAWMLEVKCNAYIIPEYEITTYSNGVKTKKLIGLYPIASTSETYNYDNDVITFATENGNVEAKYSEIIHLKKHYHTSDSIFGSIDRSDLLHTLQINDMVKKLIPKVVQTSMQMKGVLTANSMADEHKLANLKTQFENSTKTGGMGIAVVDVAGNFTPININPQAVDPQLISLLDKNVMRSFGVSENILLGNANEDEWASFYQKNIEPFKIELEQAMTSVLFTAKELSYGNKIKCYDKLVQHYTIATRLAILEKLGQNGYLSRSEQRALVGYEPDGGPDKVSLNYVDADKANEYQNVNKSQNKDENENKDKTQTKEENKDGENT